MSHLLKDQRKQIIVIKTHKEASAERIIKDAVFYKMSGLLKMYNF